MVRALWKGEVIAQSGDTVIIDGNHYFPADAVDSAYLHHSDTKTFCGWKGRASYYSLVNGDETFKDAAWYYPSASTAAKAIEGRIAFGRAVKIEDEGRAGRGRSLFDRFRRTRADGADEPRTTDASATAPVSEFDDASFFEALDGNVTIVDFWAPWCEPCKTLHPMFERAAAEHAGQGLQFARINVDDSPGVSSAFAITSIPTILVFDAADTVIGREVGLPGKRRLDQLVRVARSATQQTAGQGVA